MTRTDLQHEAVKQTVVLALVVTLQMQPVSMTDQAVQQQQPLQLSLRRLRQALRKLIQPNMSGAKKHDRARLEKQRSFRGVMAMGPA